MFANITHRLTMCIYSQQMQKSGHKKHNYISAETQLCAKIYKNLQNTFKLVDFI